MSIAADWPTSREVLEYYRIALSALDEAARTAIAQPYRIPSHQFPNDSKIQSKVEEIYAKQRTELEHQVVLMLTASFEAIFQVDFRDRVENRRRDDLSKALRDFHKRLQRRKRGSGRASFEELLDIWKAHTGNAQAIGQLNQLVQYRHWLAHGRYWNQKSGLSLVDPFEATQRGRQVLDALRDHSKLLAVTADELVL